MARGDQATFLVENEKPYLIEFHKRVGKSLRCDDCGHLNPEGCERPVHDLGCPALSRRKVALKRAKAYANSRQKIST